MFPAISVAIMAAYGQKVQAKSKVCRHTMYQCVQNYCMLVCNVQNPCTGPASVQSMHNKLNSVQQGRLNESQNDHLISIFSLFGNHELHISLKRPISACVEMTDISDYLDSGCQVDLFMV